MRLTDPLRLICAQILDKPESIFTKEKCIIHLLQETQVCVNYLSAMPIHDIEMQLTEEEIRKGVIMRTLKRNYAGMDHKNLPVAPNSPLANTLIRDKVIDMLLFLTLRF